MVDNKRLNYIESVIQNMPNDWLNLTTHRLDIFEEKLAKTQFIDQFENLYRSNNSNSSALNDLPTAYDYIRLGHPLSCVLEWGIAHLNNLNPKNVISFSSNTTPILAVLRKNSLDKKNTQILYTDALPHSFDAEIIRNIYGYNFELKKIEHTSAIPNFDGSTIFISNQNKIDKTIHNDKIDFFISLHEQLGSVIFINGEQNENYISAIQHVRRRETIAMTPANCLVALKSLIHHSVFDKKKTNFEANKKIVLDAIANITGTKTKALVGSSGLSIQYAIVMGLIDYANEKHHEKAIKIIVPPNCYGGTNDQARRVAACLDNVEVVDLPVDGGNDMVQGINIVLDKIAQEDAIPYIIAEIPTNPRVEVPDLKKLKAALSKKRKTATGEIAIDPVFILDQTFCPNVHFLGEERFPMRVARNFQVVGDVLLAIVLVIKRQMH